MIALPFLPVKSAEQASEVLWKLYEKYPAIQKEFADVQPLLLYTTSPYFLLTTKKQVKTLEDLKGMKIRIPGGPPTEMAKALGAVPTPIPMPDMYQALDKGVVDGMGVPWEAVQGFRLYEVAKYYTMVPLFVAYFSLCANKQKWTSLPHGRPHRHHERERAHRREILGQELLRHRRAGRARPRSRPAITTWMRYELPPAEVARWQKIAGEPLWEEWVKKMEGKGHKDAREILNTTLEMLKKLAATAASDRIRGMPSAVMQPIGKWLWRCELVLVARRRARHRRHDAAHQRGRAQPLPVQPADHRRLRDHRKIPDGGGDLPRPVLCLPRRHLHPRDLPGRPAAARAAACSPTISRISSRSPICLILLVATGPAGAARARRRHHADHAAAAWSGRPICWCRSGSWR